MQLANLPLPHTSHHCTHASEHSWETVVLTKPLTHVCYRSHTKYHVWLWLNCTKHPTYWFSVQFAGLRAPAQGTIPQHCASDFVISHTDNVMCTSARICAGTWSTWQHAVIAWRVLLESACLFQSIAVLGRLWLCIGWQAVWQPHSPGRSLQIETLYTCSINHGM